MRSKYVQPATRFIGDATVCAKWLPFARKTFRALDGPQKGHTFKKVLDVGEARIFLERYGDVRKILIFGGVIAGIILDPQTVRDENPDRPYVLIEPGKQSDLARQFEEEPDAALYKVKRGTTLDTDPDKVFGDMAWRARGEYAKKEARLSWRSGGVYRAGKKLVSASDVKGACVLGNYVIVAAGNDIYAAPDAGSRIPWSNFESVYSQEGDSVDLPWISPGGTKMVFWVEDANGDAEMVDVSLAVTDTGLEATEDRRRSAGDPLPRASSGNNPFEYLTLKGTNNLSGLSGPWDGSFNFKIEPMSHSATYVSGVSWDSWDPAKGEEETYTDIVTTRTIDLEFDQTQQATVGTDYSGSSTQTSKTYFRDLVVSTVPGFGEITVFEDLVDYSWTLNNTWTTTETNGEYTITGNLDLTITGTDRKIDVTPYAYTNGPCDFLHTLVDERGYSGTFTEETYTVEGQEASDAIDVGFTLSYLKDADDPDSEWHFIPDESEDTTFGYRSIAIFGPLPVEDVLSPSEISAERANLWADMTSVDVRGDDSVLYGEGNDTYEIRIDGDVIHQYVAEYTDQIVGFDSVYTPALAEHVQLVTGASTNERHIRADNKELEATIGSATSDPPEDYPSRRYNTAYAGGSQMTLLELLSYGDRQVSLKISNPFGSAKFKNHGLMLPWAHLMNRYWVEDKGVVCIATGVGGSWVIRDADNNPIHYDHINGVGDEFTNVLHDYISVPAEEVTGVYII